MKKLAQRARNVGLSAARLQLAAVINLLIVAQRLTDASVAKRFEISQRKISELKNRHDDFSADDLMSFLTALGVHVEIRLTPRPSIRSRGRIAVRSEIPLKRSRILREVHETAEGMYRSGVIDKRTIRKFRGLTFAEALATMPNVGKDEDFARHQ